MLINKYVDKMKKTLLFAILALSMNAFAQTNMSATLLPKPGLNSLNKVNGKVNLPPGTKDKIASVMQAQLKNQSLNKDAYVQLFDSIFMWEWEQSLTGWMYAYKINDFEYDANNSRIDFSVKTWNGNNWGNFIREHLSYDGNNNLITLIDKEWDGSDWINSDQDIYTYDANNNKLSFLSQSWNGSEWFNVYKSTYTYDASNNNTSETGQTWAGNDWLNNYKIINQFDASNNLTSETYLTWPENSWENSFQTIYTYNANNNLLSSLFQDWVNSEWINNSQSNYTYDESNNLVLIVDQIWDGTTWNNSNQIVSDYDIENKLIHESGQYWNGTEWSHSWQNTYTYNEQDSLIMNFGQYLNISEWVNASLSLFDYDETSNFKISQSNKLWDFTSNEIMGGDSIYYYFHTENAGINDALASEPTITVYPVPVNDKLTVKSTNEINSIAIYNLMGEQVYSRLFNESRECSIDLSGLAKGTYMLRADNRIKTKNLKIIVY
jgi:hypothetical protein